MGSAIAAILFGLLKYMILLASTFVFLRGFRGSGWIHWTSITLFAIALLVPTLALIAALWFRDSRIAVLKGMLAITRSAALVVLGFMALAVALAATQ